MITVTSAIDNKVIYLNEKKILAVFESENEYVPKAKTCIEMAIDDVYNVLEAPTEVVERIEDAKRQDMNLLADAMRRELAWLR